MRGYKEFADAGEDKGLRIRIVLFSPAQASARMDIPLTIMYNHLKNVGSEALHVGILKINVF